MIELFQEATASYNIPVTILLGMVVLYWLIVILGFADSDIGMDGGSEVSPPLSTGLSSALGGSGGWKRLGIGPIPLSVFGSIFAILLWLLSLWTNYYLNGEPGKRSVVLALAYAIPNLTLSYLLTQVILWPLRGFFAEIYNRNKEEPPIQGKVAIVLTSLVDESYGQVEIPSSGAPILLNARVMPGATPLAKGSKVVITEPSSDGAFYFVKPFISSTSSTSP